MADSDIKQLSLFGEEEKPIRFIGNRSVFATLGATNHTISERDGDDFYSTDPMAIDKLLSKMQLHDNIWECAAGNGALSERLKEYGSQEWWQTEPGVGRVVAGVPDRVDRLRCLGNAVVPYQAYPIFKAIAKIERGEL